MDATCQNCGGEILGDGYTSPRHCENVDCPDDRECDAPTLLCSVYPTRLEFSIERTSSRWDSDVAPCADAVPHKPGYPSWSIEFGDLTAMLAFIRKHGPCVVRVGTDCCGDDSAPLTGHIEIYDDYRE